MEATRGWDIASLQLGVLGIAPSHAAVFGLFCRYFHFLLHLPADLIASSVWAVCFT